MGVTPDTLLNQRYRIVEILGQGGMGAVYRATDEILNVSVAVKENLFLAEEYTRQFQREASILANLRHPNLPRVGDYCSLPGQGQYLIMDFIEGEDLRQRIERLGYLPEREVILIGVRITDALTYLHSRQPPVIHRDIKPGNIKITPEGEVFLVDFGLAKVSGGAQATTTGARAMTPGYSPPEQYGTARTDARSDIYSLSATLYAALTGSIPEDGLNRMTGKARLTPVRRLQPGVNRKLEATIEKAMAIDPEDRFQTAEEYKKALIESGEMTHIIKPIPTVTPPPDPGAIETEIITSSSEDSLSTDNQMIDPVNRIREKATSSIRKYAWLPIMIMVLIGGWMVIQEFINNGSENSSNSTSIANATIQQSQAMSQTSKEIQGTINKTSLPEKTSSPTKSNNNASIPVAIDTVIPESTALGGSNDTIIFSSNRSGTMQLWSMNTDGTHQTQFTSIEGGACQPSWSHDGLQLAFISPCDGKREVYEGSKIYIMDANGNDLHILPVEAMEGGDWDPVWSPDGKRIAFTSLRTGMRHIFVYNFETLSLDELSNTPYPDKQPAWSPGGKQLTFTRQENVWRIWLVYDNGHSSSQFSMSGFVNNTGPVWSPDGDYILYSQTAANGSVPWLVKLRYEDRATPAEKRINPSNWDSSFPVANAQISPDGKWIMFESWPDGRNHDIYKMEEDGENLSRLTTDPDFDFNPVWRPALVD